MQQPPRGQPAISMPLVKPVMGLQSRKAVNAQQALQGQPTVSMPLLIAGTCRASWIDVCSRSCEASQHSVCKMWRCGKLGASNRCHMY